MNKTTQNKTGEPPSKRQKLENQQNPLIVNNVEIQQSQRPAPINPMFANPSMMMNPMYVLYHIFILLFECKDK